MAKLNGPLFSLEASGQIGKTLIYSKWKGIQYAKSYVRPANPRTPEQVAWRNYFAEIAEYWNHPRRASIYAMHSCYNCSAGNQGLRMTGYNLFLRTYTRIPQDERCIIEYASVAYAPDESWTDFLVYTELPNIEVTFSVVEIGRGETSPVTVTTDENGRGAIRVDYLWNADGKFAAVVSTPDKRGYLSHLYVEFAGT